jgi:hypothetical protein
LNGPPSARDVLPQYLNDLGARKPFAAKPSKRLKALTRGDAAERSLRRYFGAESSSSDSSSSSFASHSAANSSPL